MRMDFHLRESHLTNSLQTNVYSIAFICMFMNVRRSHDEMPQSLSEKTEKKSVKDALSFSLIH